MSKLLDTSKQHRRTTPIPMSPPEPDMTKLFQTGRALGRKRKRVASAVGILPPPPPSADVPTVMEVDEPVDAPAHVGVARSPSLEVIAGPFRLSTAMDVDPPPAATVQPGVARSPSVEIISGPFRTARHTSRPNPVDPATSPMNFSSASEEPASETEDSDTPRPDAPQSPARYATVSKTASITHKRKRSDNISSAGPSRTTNQPHALPVPPVVPAATPPPAHHTRAAPSMGVALSEPVNIAHSNKGKGKAVAQDPPPLPGVPPTDPHPLRSQPSVNTSSGHRRSRFATAGETSGPGINPAAWHPYTGGGPGLVRSMDRFESLMETTRENEKHFMATVSLI